VAHVKELRVVLTVDDFEAALAFYRDALGLEQLEDWSGENGRVVLLGAGRGTLELFDERQAESVDELEVGRRVAGPVRLAFRVDDSAETADRLAAAGGEVIAGPVETPWRDLNVRLTSPDGTQLTLFAPLD
jgi:methylmalonyl-CoA/ethylmalonyl-CoA epimerase